jgi:UDP-GlcNAc:undecaprenyl-phosphate/decaprenyl-phosphate GlcNAc-1-phosphate transferase
MLTALTFAVAVVTGLVTTPIVRDVAIRRGWLDQPGGRKIHDVPIPRLGGVAIVIAFAVGVAAATVASPGLTTRFGDASDRLVPILVGVAVLAAVGVVDDVNGMRARVKLLAQIGAAVVAWILGLRLEEIHALGTVLDLGWASLPVTVLWTVAVINAVNLIDGLDGLASGVVLTALGAFAVIASVDGPGPTLIVTAAIAGAAVGFLAYNLYPASIIMGDTGSMVLGFVVAAIGASLMQDGAAPVAPWVPVIALAVPVVDTGWAVIRRLGRGGSVFEADAGHIHHQLLRRGASTRDTMLILTAISAAAAILAILLGRIS